MSLSLSLSQASYSSQIIVFLLFKYYARNELFYVLLQATRGTINMPTWTSPAATWHSLASRFLAYILYRCLVQEGRSYWWVIEGAAQHNSSSLGLLLSILPPRQCFERPPAHRSSRPLCSETCTVCRLLYDVGPMPTTNCSLGGYWRCRHFGCLRKIQSRIIEDQRQQSKSAHKERERLLRC